MKKERLLPAIDKLADIFDHIDWQYVEAPPGSNLEKTELWPGEPGMPPTEKANRRSSLSGF